MKCVGPRTYLEVVAVPLVVFTLDVDTEVDNVEGLLVVLATVLEVLDLIVDVDVELGPAVAVGEGRDPHGDP